MRDHHAGRAERTKNQRPLLLLHLDPLPTYADALRREQRMLRLHSCAWAAILSALYATWYLAIAGMSPSVEIAVECREV
jgi:hypothetical protein